MENPQITIRETADFDEWVNEIERRLVEAEDRIKRDTMKEITRRYIVR